MSIVDRTQIEPGCTVLMNNKVGPLTNLNSVVTLMLSCRDAYVWRSQHCLSIEQKEGQISGKSLLNLLASCFASYQPWSLLVLQVLSVVGLLQDETDPMVSVMKARLFCSQYAYKTDSITNNSCHWAF